MRRSGSPRRRGPGRRDVLGILFCIVGGGGGGAAVSCVLPRVKPVVRVAFRELRKSHKKRNTLKLQEKGDKGDKAEKGQNGEDVHAEANMEEDGAEDESKEEAPPPTSLRPSEPTYAKRCPYQT